jgi:hypothetical protein
MLASAAAWGGDVAGLLSAQREMRDADLLPGGAVPVQDRGVAHRPGVPGRGGGHAVQRADVRAGLPSSLDRHATYIVAAYIAGAAR